MTRAACCLLLHKMVRMFAMVMFAMPAFGEQIEDRWWPVQVLPKAIVKTDNKESNQPRRLVIDMMLQSIAGLAAKSVNENRGDEMVWATIDDNVDVEDWFARLFQRYPQLHMRGMFSPWGLVDRYTKQGLIKGYVLYRPDLSKGETS